MFFAAYFRRGQGFCRDFCRDSKCWFRSLRKCRVARCCYVELEPEPLYIPSGAMTDQRELHQYSTWKSGIANDRIRNCQTRSDASTARKPSRPRLPSSRRLTSLSNSTARPAVGLAAVATWSRRHLLPSNLAEDGLRRRWTGRALSGTLGGRVGFAFGNESSRSSCECRYAKCCSIAPAGGE